MKVLVVAATQAELASFVAARPDVERLVTGVGMVATAAAVARALAGSEYELALNIGVCGTFDRSLALGCVVHVVSDRMSELGAEDGDAFLSIEELGLPAAAGVTNHAPPKIDALDRLPKVTGITVNTVHGNQHSIDAIARRFKPQVETMEGAAFMLCCQEAGVPYAQVRAISNVVERRDKASWTLAEAIANLGAAATRIVEAS
jgi:futalosine hydrolase